MFKKILVPVDGSPFSEAVLPHIRTLATRYNATVHLVRVRTPEPYEPPLGVVLTSIPEPLQVAPADRLDMLAEQFKVEGIAATTEVVDGHAAEGILDCAKRESVDLIAMTTHGRSGLSRWWLGSVATKVVHASPVPVLLVRLQKN
jgi:nucleotide-binding universal stress UspA family protein